MKRLLLLSLFAGNIFAATVTTYASRPDFEAGLSSFNTWNFNGREGNPVTVLNSLGTDIAAVSTLGGAASGVIHDNALCGTPGAPAVDCFSPVAFTFLQPVNGFGFDNLDFNGLEEAVVNVAFANGDPVQQFVFDLGAQPAFTPIFFGLTSDVDVSAVVIYSRDPGSSTIGARANIVDNVTIGTTGAVPEPGTLAVFISGIGLLIAAKRRSS